MQLTNSINNKAVGFGTRKDLCHKDRRNDNMLDKIFYCQEGKQPKDKRDYEIKKHRAETWYGCDALVKIGCQFDQFRIGQFVAIMNFQVQVKTHLFRSY